MARNRLFLQLFYMLYGEQILISGITRHFQGFQRSASLFEAYLPLSLPPKPPRATTSRSRHSLSPRIIYSIPSVNWRHLTYVSRQFNSRDHEVRHTLLFSSLFTETTLMTPDVYFMPRRMHLAR